VIDLPDFVCLERFDYTHSEIRNNTVLNYLDINKLLGGFGNHTMDMNLLSQTDVLLQSIFHDLSNIYNTNILTEFNYYFNNNGDLVSMPIYIYYNSPSDSSNKQSLQFKFSLSNLKMNKVNFYLNAVKTNKIFTAYDIDLTQQNILLNKYSSDISDINQNDYKNTHITNNLENFHLFNLTTLKNKALFHNRINLNSLYGKYYSNNTEQANDNCLYIFQHLNEDLYIEKNELLNGFKGNEYNVI